MLRKISVLILVFVLGLIVCPLVSADIIMANVSCRTDITKPDENRSDGSKLSIRSDNKSQKSWIKFDLDGLDVANLSSATLTLTLQGDKGGSQHFDVSYVKDSCMDNINWAEKDLTWNNAPGNNTSDYGALNSSKTTHIGTLYFTDGVAGDSFSIDVMDELKTDSDSIAQFVLHNSTGYMNIATHDHSDADWRPFLDVTVAAAPDNDNDGIPDSVDDDDDNDGHLDVDDAFPFDETEWDDTDGDGVGNNADTDDDNDGQSDADEIACGSDPLDDSSMSPDNDLDHIPDCVDPDDDNDGILDGDDAEPFNPNWAHALTISSSDGGDVTDPGEGIIPTGDGIALGVVATADSHYHFVEWTGTAVDAGKVADPGLEVTTVTMDGNYTLMAHFAIDQHVLTLSSSAGGAIVTPGEGDFLYDYGQKIQLGAQSDDPLFEFSHFEGYLWAGYTPYGYAIRGDARIRAIFRSVLDVLYVDAGIPEGQYENGSLENPFDSIQEAIEVAVPGATIVIRSGVYAENLSLLHKSVVLTGMDVNDANDWAFPVIQGVDEAPVITVRNVADPNTLLQGLIITQGNGKGAGGLDCHTSQLTLSNCLIVGNRCDFAHGMGGALRAYKSQVDLMNCTVSDNYGGQSGAALNALSNSTLTVLDSILWNNVQGEVLADETSSVVIEYSDVTGGYEGVGNLDVDPGFVTLGHWEHALNPGMVVSPTQYYAIWMQGDYHLAENSPCIDAGDSSAASDLEPEPNGERVNLGAYGNTPQATTSSVE